MVERGKVGTVGQRSAGVSHSTIQPTILCSLKKIPWLCREADQGLGVKNIL